MKKLFVMLAIASFAVANFSAASFAQDDNAKADHHKDHNKECFKKRHEKFVKKLNLTQEQQDQIKSTREQSRAEMKPLFEQLRSEWHNYKKLSQSNATPEALKQQKEKIHQLRDQIREIHKKNFEKFESILTPEQKAKFEQMKKNHHHHHHHHYHEFGDDK